MEKLTRWDKIYLDKEKTQESAVNAFLNCRDGIVEVVEYTDEFGYGNQCRDFKCQDIKNEIVAIIRQTKVFGKWVEDAFYFDSDSFKVFQDLMDGNGFVVRNYGEQ